tara:strand:+ start:117 stop:254 length:138 start_codon:yes stop_codon:yes gene_type:complete
MDIRFTIAAVTILLVIEGLSFSIFDPKKWWNWKELRVWITPVIER